ncbi:hypothetical protein BC360_00205 [Ensifer sp. LC163]|nr:hypothetical protein BC360_00205 [Ensifer sp. LC163]
MLKFGTSEAEKIPFGHVADRRRHQPDPAVFRFKRLISQREYLGLQRGTEEIRPATGFRGQDKTNSQIAAAGATLGLSFAEPQAANLVRVTGMRGRPDDARLIVGCS